MTSKKVLMEIVYIHMKMEFMIKQIIIQGKQQE